MTFDEICSYITKLVKPVFDAAPAEFEYSRNTQAPPASHGTLWGRLSVQEFADNKRSIQGRIGTRVFASQGRATVQLFGKPGGENAPLDALYTTVKRVFQDDRPADIEFISVSGNFIGIDRGWDTINVDVDYVAYYRR